MADLSRKRERERLKIQHNPHVMKLAKGCYLGFRRGPNTWLARYRDRAGKQHFMPLEGETEYDEAKVAAEAWFARMSNTAVRRVKRGATVAQALDAYLDDLRSEGRHDSAKDIEGKFKTVILGDKIAAIALESATKDDFTEWRSRLCKGREARTVNRHVRAVAAGLNRAVEELGYVGPPSAWKLNSLADDVEECGESAVFLSPAQRRAIVAFADEHASKFFRGLEYTGARPKELAAAVVRDFDGKSIRLASRKGKQAKLRLRHSVLSSQGVDFFRTLTMEKPSTSPIFTEDGETPWRRHTWSRRFRAAATVANKSSDEAISPEASCYSFRHARISELLQVHGIDPLTVAQQTGTSVAMIEKTYLKFIESAFRAKLESLREE